MIEWSYATSFSLFLIVTSLSSNEIMRCSFLCAAGGGKKRSELWIAEALMLFHRHTQTESGGTEYVFKECTECTPALDEMEKEVGYMSLR